jgi:Fe-S-cluster containining protein
LDVDVSPADIRAIAEFLGSTEADVRRLYVTEEHTLWRTKGACVFLHGNLCLIYPVRPRACRDFPHIHAQGVSLGSRMSSICRHAAVCPILFNAIEEYKHRTGFHPRACGED